MMGKSFKNCHTRQMRLKSISYNLSFAKLISGSYTPIKLFFFLFDLLHKASHEMRLK